MRGVIYFFIFLLVCTLSILFFAQNDQEVVLSYFIGQSNIPLAFIMVGFLVLGYLVGWISLSGTMLKHKIQIRQSKRQLEQKSKEVENLRSLPIRDDY
ncbi:LapA family protein [Pleionea sediminis]|uniref:LapA family protein n=1 Tax=Pleionea sediminis TaxID=2569479 RepID=UPI001184E028|nr:LapA family protein [Pleionea sediminis]